MWFRLLFPMYDYFIYYFFAFLAHNSWSSCLNVLVGKYNLLFVWFWWLGLLKLLLYISASILVNLFDLNPFSFDRLFGIKSMASREGDFHRSTYPTVRGPIRQYVFRRREFNKIEWKWIKRNNCLRWFAWISTFLHH